MKRPIAIGGAVLAVCAAVIATVILMPASAPPESCQAMDAPPEVFPEYDGTTIPPNIAPMNFVVRKPAQATYARLRPASGQTVGVHGSDGRIQFPPAQWRAMLDANRGRTVELDVYVKDGQWRKAPAMRLSVANEPVGSHVVYRQLPTVYNIWMDLQIRQRCIENFDDEPVLDNAELDRACMNCHSFCERDPSRMLFHTRPDAGTPGKHRPPSMVVAADGRVERHETRGAPGTMGPAGYISWHPSGKAVAFASSAIRQFFHTGASAGQEPRDVVDLDADVAIYLLEQRRTIYTSQTANPAMIETFPSWSPDGRWLYYSSAPITWSDRKEIPYDRVTQVRHSLMRVEVDLDAEKIGTPEEVVSCNSLKGSIVQPRISPDGRFVVFTRCDYGGFPVNQASADLYIVDLRAPGGVGRPVRLECNSDRTDSWHSWSSNGRWLIFASKRLDGLFGRLYLTHIDEEGHASKPVLLPMEDPTAYDRSIVTQNLPELITGPVRIPSRELARAAKSPDALKPATRPASAPVPGGAMKY